MFRRCRLSSPLLETIIKRLNVPFQAAIFSFFAIVKLKFCGFFYKKLHFFPVKSYHCWPSINLPWGLVPFFPLMEGGGGGRATTSQHWDREKEIKSFPQTQIFQSPYLCNLKVQTFDIFNLDYFSQQIS